MGVKIVILVKIFIRNVNVKFNGNKKLICIDENLAELNMQKIVALISVQKNYF